MAKLAAMMANKGRAIVPGEPDIFTKDSTFDEILQDLDDYEEDAIFPHLVLNNLRGGLLKFPNDECLQISDQDKKAEFIGGVGASGSVFLFNEKYKIGFAYVTNGYYGDGFPDERSLAILRSIFETVVKNSKGK